MSREAPTDLRPRTVGVSTRAADMPLESLTPKYVEAHHGTYLRRLEEAVKDPKNLNIALTGRYGAGKSSVLDKFAANHDKKVLRLAISTLAPGEEGESTTNRIQKEIVKQLLYGASEKVGKNSRFNKIAVLSWPKALAQSAAFVLALGALAYVFGVLPNITVLGGPNPTWIRFAAWVGVAVLVTGLVASIRMLTHGRFNVSDVSAGGAAITLSEKPQTFFDKYIDEIVHYFGQESKDIVIFEDLDRFEDPFIFEALRELNVLLNNTPERRRKHGGAAVGRAQPLRFIYAVRDSVFSRIDAEAPENALRLPNADPDQDPQSSQPGRERNPSSVFDEAAAETLRANRTKFFDVVIPLVPFISHRNARDLLAKLLVDRGITGIHPRLVNTVAQHCTDMRLMRNMCNEYLVFAERLLEATGSTNSAPGLDATHLFALVVYKNFHLEDFENITRRDSDLDKLYDYAQRIIRETITAHEERIRELLKKPEAFRVREPRANRLGQRLALLASNVMGAHSSPYSTQWRYYRLKVGNRDFDSGQLSDYRFWAAVAKARSLDIVLAMQPSGGQTTVAQTFDEDGLLMFAPEALDAERWAAFDRDAIDAEVAEKEREIDELRRAGFAELAATGFTLTLQDGEAAAGNPTDLEAPKGPHTFAQLIEVTLKSKLARELVRRGYVDRNFSLYAAQFYGNFTGVDVANFMVQHVQPNVMNIDYDLSRQKKGESEGAAANLLLEAEEAGEDLLNTVVAYNIDLLNYLLVNDHPGANTVAAHLITGWPGEEARSFLAAYFTSKKAQREKLAALLARCHWREVYAYLTTNDDVPADVRATLVNAALTAFDSRGRYDLDDNVRDFVTANYGNMPVFTGAEKKDRELDNVTPEGTDEYHSERHSERVNEMLRLSQVVLPELRPLQQGLRERVVENDLYRLTADNLRLALGLSEDAPVPLDVLADSHFGNKTVYAYCLANLMSYLAAVRGDARTAYAVNTPDTLVRVLGDAVDRWTDDQAVEDEQPLDLAELTSLLEMTSRSARLGELRETPEVTWEALVEAKMVRSSLANIEIYRAHVGSVDAHLAGLLEEAGTVYVEEGTDVTSPDGDEYPREPAAIAILNAKTLSPGLRVTLVTVLDPAPPLPIDEIEVGPDELVALLIDHGLVKDEQRTFERARAGGWQALGPALKSSHNISTFSSPALLSGMVAQVLADPDTAEKLGARIVSEIDDYVPTDDWAALRATADYAYAQQLSLPPQVIVRIARVGAAAGSVDLIRPQLLRLLTWASPEASAEEIIETFAHLGGEYGKITHPGAKFKVDHDETHDRLLSALRTARRITRRATPGKTHYSIKVL